MRRLPFVLILLTLIGCGQIVDRRSEAARPAGGAAPDLVAASPVAPAMAPGAPPAAPLPIRIRPSARPPAPPIPGAPAGGARLPRIDPVPGRVGLVIGIDRYPSAPDLTAAVADAELVDDALRRLGFDEVRLLTDGAATRSAILSSLRWLAASSTAGEPVALFYAGHVRRGSGDGDRETVDEAMLAADGELVFDGEVAEALRPARGPMWLAYAACYAAGFSDAASRGRVSTYASAEDRLAFESPELGRSFMVEFMIRRGLFGAGLSGVEDMYRYASNQMEGRYRRFRPLQDDRFAGPLVLGGPAVPEEGDDLCVAGLLCS